MIGQIRLNLQRCFKNFHKKFMEKLSLSKNISKNIHKYIASNTKSLTGVINKKSKTTSKSDFAKFKRNLFNIKSYKALSKSNAQKNKKINKSFATLKSEFKIALNKIKNAIQTKNRAQTFLKMKILRASQKQENQRIAKYKSQLHIHQNNQGITRVLNILLHRSELAKEKLFANEEKLTKSLTSSIDKSKKFRMNIVNLLTRKRKSKLQVGQKKFANAKKIHRKNHDEILMMQQQVVKFLGNNKNSPKKDSVELVELRKKLIQKRESYKISGATLNKKAKSLKGMVNALSKFEKKKQNIEKNLDLKLKKVKQTQKKLLKKKLIGFKAKLSILNKSGIPTVTKIELKKNLMKKIKKSSKRLGRTQKKISNLKKSYFKTLKKKAIVKVQKFKKLNKVIDFQIAQSNKQVQRLRSQVQIFRKEMNQESSKKVQDKVKISALKKSLTAYSKETLQA